MLRRREKDELGKRKTDIGNIGKEREKVEGVVRRARARVVQHHLIGQKVAD